MAVQTLQERLLTDAVLPTTVRTALGLASSVSVYGGRRARKVQQDREVFVEPLGSERRTSGGHQIYEHRFDLHILHRGQTDGAVAGRAQSDAVRDDVRALVNTLDGTRTWRTSLSDLVSVAATEGLIDANPSDVRSVEGVVRLSVLTKGSGDVTT